MSLSLRKVVVSAFAAAVSFGVYATDQGWGSFTASFVGRDCARIASSLMWHGDGATKSSVWLEYGTDPDFGESPSRYRRCRRRGGRT